MLKVRNGLKYIMWFFFLVGDLISLLLGSSPCGLLSKSIKKQNKNTNLKVSLAGEPECWKPLCSAHWPGQCQQGGKWGGHICWLYLHRIQPWLGCMERCGLLPPAFWNSMWGWWPGVGVPSLSPGTVCALFLLVTITPLPLLTVRPPPSHLAFHSITFNKFCLCRPLG